MAKTASRVLRTGGLWFDGVAGYVNVPSTPTLSGLNNITVMAWVCPTKTTEGTIVSKTDNAYNKEWMLYISPHTYKYHFIVYDVQAGTYGEVIGSLVQIGVPVFLAGTYDGSVLRIYENAVLKSQATTDIVIRPRSAPVRIGNRADNARFYGGIIDEPRIYNRALSSYEISEIYTKGTFIKDGLILYLPFYEGEGNIAHDVSGYGNHGTIYGACLAGDSLIYTPEGPIPISEIKIGQKVFSYDRGIVEKTVFDKIKRGRKAVYKVKTANREIYATLNHPFLVAVWGGQRQVKGYNFQKGHPFCYRENICFPEWKSLEAIKEGDLIAVLHHLPNQEKETEFSEDFMRLIGCFLGDGYVLIRRSKREGRIGLCLTKQTEQGKYCEILDKLGIRYITNPKEILIYSRKLALKFRELELEHNVKDKYIPSWVWKLPKKYIKALIEGLVDADGWIIKQTPSSYVLQIALSNYELIKQTRALCHYIGLRTSNIYYRRREGRMLEGRMLPSSDEWSFQIYPYDERHKQPRVIVNRSRRRMNIILPDELEFQVVNQIEFAGEREVWDIAIPETHNFIAEGILLHNSWVVKKALRVLPKAG